MTTPLTKFIEAVSRASGRPLDDGDRSALAALQPFFDLVSPGGDLYCRTLAPAGDLDVALLREELSRFLGEPVDGVVVVSNAGEDRPWRGDLSPYPSDCRLFAYAVGEIGARGQAEDPDPAGQVLSEHLTDELSSNLRATFTDGLEDEVFWGIDSLLGALVRAVVAGDAVTRDRFARFLPTLTRCAPLAESKTSPGTWYVFVR
jgi:hypothetical protein